MKKINKNWGIFLSVLFCLVILYVCTVTGIAAISFEDASRILLHEVLHLHVSIEGISEGSILIIKDVRLPRVVLGFLAGASLAVCGAGFLGFLRFQPLADGLGLGIGKYLLPQLPFPLQLRFQCFQFAAGLAHFLIGGVNGGF